MLNRPFQEQGIHPGPPEQTTSDAPALPASGRLDYAVYAHGSGSRNPWGR